MIDSTLAIEEDRKRRLKPGHQMIRHLNGGLHDNRVIAEIVVDTNAPSIVILHRIIDTIPDVLLTVILSHIVRKLTLHEICSSTLSIPLDQISGGVLTHETVHGHIIAIDDGSVRARIVAINDASPAYSVISAPQPQIITDHLTGINLEHAVRLHS